MSSVIVADACPSIRWTAFTLAPALTASEAAVCRRSLDREALELRVILLSPSDRGDVPAAPAVRAAHMIGAVAEEELVAALADAQEAQGLDDPC